jgi:hypothetical protein
MLSSYFYNLTNAIWHQKIFSFFILLSTVSLIFDSTGFYHVPHEYINMLHKIITYYIVTVLIIRFNPWMHKSVYSKEITEYDRQLSFTSGMVLLTTNVFNVRT